MSSEKNSPPWAAPERAHALEHALSLPGSKSLTNRELVLSAIASGPSLLRRPLHSRDTELMVKALEALGATITSVAGDGEFGPDYQITPFVAGSEVRATIDCGLAGTVMRFVPPLSLIRHGTIAFDGDSAARRRPMATTLDALSQLGVEVDVDASKTLPFSLQGSGVTPGGDITIDASASSQFISGLLLVAALLPQGLTIRHSGKSLPSLPHIEMTMETLRQRGVAVSSPGVGVWRVEPGHIGPREVMIEPDLSNAAPFLAAPLITGGQVSITGWPNSTTQVGARVPELLETYGAKVRIEGERVTIDGGIGWRNGGEIPGVDLDLGQAGELAPTFISLSALSREPSRFRGIGHLRGHETDRLQALVANINALGGDATETADGVAIAPRALDGGLWHAYEDHRMATSGALLGLGVRGIMVDDIACTAKTLPEFESLWSDLVESATP